MALFKVENLGFIYNGSKNMVIRNVNLTIEKGEFVVICGASGCGKSTLLRLLKPQISPRGEISGKILYDNEEICKQDSVQHAGKIGFVMQNPENQIVCDKVWHELAFGLENLQYSQNLMQQRIAEVCGYFGISAWYNKRTDELSGGEKQLLNLAAIMAMTPQVILLDEPTAQLDPIAASEFISMLKKMNDELGLTILIVEHRLEQVLPIASRVVGMDGGEILFDEKPSMIASVQEKMSDNPRYQSILKGLPVAARVFYALNGKGECPLTVREGKEFLLKNYATRSHDCGIVNELAREKDEKKNRAVYLKDVWFRYERNSPDILRGLTLSIRNNEILSIMGANGAGKTTLLQAICASSKIYKGEIEIFGKTLKDYRGAELYRKNIAYLPQNPQLVFVSHTLEEELKETVQLLGRNVLEQREAIDRMVNELDIGTLLGRHPYDLSGGEQQMAALAKLLLLEPKLLLLDEPTKGIDSSAKEKLSHIISNQKKMGRTIVFVTHDIEFAAEHSDRCAMFFNGKIVSVDTPVNFFSQNSYYTTSASRMSRELYHDVVSAKQLIERCNNSGEKKYE